MLLLTILIAASAAPLEPTASWQLVAEENYCILSRDFGSNTTLALQPFYDGDSLELTIVSPEPPLQAFAGSASLTFGSDIPITSSFVTNADRTGARRFTKVQVPTSRLTSIAAPTTLAVHAGALDVTFRLARMVKPLMALKTCHDDLVKSWNGGSSASQGGKAVVLQGASIARYFSSDSYPDEARDAHEQGLVTVALRIDNTGKAVACRTRSAASMSLAQRTCAIALQQLRFNPARDASGTATGSTYNLAVRWQLPN